MTDYKSQKEEFVSNGVGSSVSTINAVCLTAATTYALWTVVSPRTRLLNNKESWAIPCIEYALLVLPLLLGLTVLSSRPLTLNGLIVALVIWIDKLDLPLASPPLSPSMGRKQDNASTPKTLPSGRSFSKPFVTIYRAHMMLMTVICILAVDFRVFPRAFAKAETWGTSLMDLGVGSFVFSLGVISALPLLRSTDRRPFLSAVWSSAKRSGGVIALGLVRVIMVKGVDYPEHVSEYGVHWNFFFTMGLLPVFGAALEHLSPSIDFHAMALFVTFIHQILLSRTSLQQWTLHAARSSLLSQNKEGLVSLPGYLAIYLLGTATGLYVLPPDPYFYKTLHLSPPPNSTIETRRKIDDKKRRMWTSRPGKLANVLGSYAVIWWGAYAALRSLGGQVSRRVANMPYVVWIAAFNTSFLFLYLVIQSWANARPSARDTGAPAIFEAMNRNGLVVFLVANLLTGLVNVTIESMYASDSLAMIVLMVYCFLVIDVAWLLRHRRLRM